MGRNHGGGFRAMRDVHVWVHDGPREGSNDTVAPRGGRGSRHGEPPLPFPRRTLVHV